MALIHASTSEAKQIQAEGLTSVGAIVWDTEKQFDGRSCWKCAAGAENRVVRAIAGATGTTYYVRAAVRFSALAPSATLGFMRIVGAGNLELVLTTTGKVSLFNSVKGTNILSTVFAPEAEKHYLFELKVLVPAAGSGTVALRIYNEKGETGYESGDKEAEIGNTALSSASPGHFGAGTGVDVYLSHLAITDSTGAERNSWQGYEKLVALQPVADGARTGWTVPGSGVTNLWKALANRPPLGIADNNEAGNAERQIRDENNNATDTYAVELGAYSDPLASGGANLGAGDTIKFLFSQARGGTSTATSRNLAIRMESNPGPDTEVTGGTGATIAAAEPTGWAVITGTVNYSPVVAKATKPKVRLRKGTASTSAMLYDFARVVVGYVPGTLYTKTLGDTVEVSDALVKQPGKVLADSQGLSDTVSKLPTKVLSDSQELLDAVARAVRKVLGDTVETEDAIAKQALKATADTVTAQDAISKSPQKALSDTVTLGDALQVAVHRVLEFADAVGLTDGLGKQPRKALADTQATTDALIKQPRKLTSDTVGTTDTLSKATTKVLADGVSVVDALKTHLIQPLGTYLLYLGKWVKVK